MTYRCKQQKALPKAKGFTKLYLIVNLSLFGSFPINSMLREKPKIEEHGESQTRPVDFGASKN